MRTIVASSKNFTCMATFGHKIAAAWDDGSVGIYGSVTGVPRLSLTLADPVQTIQGSPDGSILFCAHKTPSITTWDMQTGGLIHTFSLQHNPEDIAVSSKGRYLACGLSDESVGVWKVAGKMEGAPMWTGSSTTRFCWLEPEEHLAVSTRAMVRIWDIVAGTILRSYTMRYPVHRMVYSRKFNRLAIMASSAPKGAMTIVDTQTHTSTTSHWTKQNFTCFTFSQTREELVCGIETHGLRLFDLPKGRWRRIEYPDTMTSISSLQNGTVVAHFGGSGIQLLSLDGYAPSETPTFSALTVHAFDQGAIIAILPTTRDQISLLELATMSQLLKIPIRGHNPSPLRSETVIICVSLKHLMAVGYFEEGGQGFLQSWPLRKELPGWTVTVDGVVEMGRISPSAARLVTFHTTGGSSRICVWNAKNGRLHAQRACTPITRLLDIEYSSDKEFTLQYTSHRTSYAVHSQDRDLLDPLLLELSHDGRDHYLEGDFLEVDDTHEWVVRGSERICWIPPGYIGSVQPSYCWAGLSLVMAGQDGILRGLKFVIGGR